MKQCKNCGRELPEEATFCPYCETEQIDVKAAELPKVWRKKAMIAAIVVVCFALIAVGIHGILQTEKPIVSEIAGDQNNDFYLEFVFPDQPGSYTNLNTQLKQTNYYHLVRLYHKVGDEFIRIDPDSVTSSEPSIVAVDYSADDKYSTGYDDYYRIVQLAVGTSMITYTYTVDGKQHMAEYAYTVEQRPE